MTRQEYLHRIDNIITGTSGAEQLPATAPVLAMWAENFMPQEQPAPHPDNMTSREIADTLEDICALSVTDVAMVMTWLGYKLTANSYRGFEWAMEAHWTTPCNPVDRDGIDTDND